LKKKLLVVGFFLLERYYEIAADGIKY